MPAVHVRPWPQTTQNDLEAPDVATSMTIGDQVEGVFDSSSRCLAPGRAGPNLQRHKGTGCPPTCGRCLQGPNQPRSGVGLEPTVLEAAQRIEGDHDLAGLQKYERAEGLRPGDHAEGLRPGDKGLRPSEVEPIGLPSRKLPIPSVNDSPRWECRIRKQQWTLGNGGPEQEMVSAMKS